MEKTLHYTDVGKGEMAIVFLHYFGGSSNTWNKVIAILRRQFRCIAIDLPGFGDSQEDLKNISVSECAKEVDHVIRSLALKQYVLTGHSMGGKIALSLATIQPPGLISIVLVAPSPPSPEPMNDVARRQLLKAYGDQSSLLKLLSNITAYPLSKADKDNVIENNMKASFASWKWWTEQGSREDISQQMLTIKTPVLVISGAIDAPLSTNFLHHEMIKYFPLATFEEIANAAHLLPLEAPVFLAEKISDFALQNF